MKLLKNIIIALLVIFVSAQFFRVQKNKGELASMHYFYADTNPSAEVKQILKVSCIDCHSDVTHYSWYNITPINYWSNKHIQAGKKHFNMSKWEGSSIKRKDHKLEELIEIFGTKEKPLETYTWPHDKANLTHAEMTSLIDWAKLVRLKYSLEPKPE